MTDDRYKLSKSGLHECVCAKSCRWMPVRIGCEIDDACLLFFAVVPQTPTITSSASGTVEDGSSFSLTCQTASTGITSAMYIWSIGGVDQAAQSSNTLVQTADINNVVAYTCKVSADGGTDYSAATTSSFSHPGRCMATFRVCACHLC